MRMIVDETRRKAIGLDVTRGLFPDYAPAHPRHTKPCAPDKIRTCDLCRRSIAHHPYPSKISAVAASRPLRYSGRNAPVAQLDRALPSEGRGHKFESCRVRQAPPNCDFPRSIFPACKGRQWESDDPVLLQNGLLIPRYPSKDLWRVFKLLHQVVNLKINGNVRFAASVVDGGPSDVRQAVVLVDRCDADITKSHVLRTDSAIVFESLLHHGASGARHSGRR